MIENIYIVFVFALGLIIGSFLNVLIYRLPREISIFKKKRSFCPKCKKALSAKELVPLFSFIFLRGRCAGCKKKISFKYPVVEFMAGLLFALAFIRLGIYGSGFMTHEVARLVFSLIIISILLWSFL